MTITAFDNLSDDFALRAQRLSAGAPSGSPDAAADFASVLSRARVSPQRQAASLEERAREAAQDFIAISLVQPILSHLREHPLVDPEEMGPLAPGVGEKTLQPLWDAQAAREIVRASNWPMVDRLAQQLLKQAGVETPARTEIDRHA